MPGRSYNSAGYRYGFNGKEKDDEVKGDGNSIDFGARIHDPRLGRLLSLDPLSKKFPSESNYSYAGNSPIFLIDQEGEKKTIYLTIITDQGSTTLKLVNEKIVKFRPGASHGSGPDGMGSDKLWLISDITQNVTLDLRDNKVVITKGKETYSNSKQSVFSLIGDVDLSGPGDMQKGGWNLTSKDGGADPTKNTSETYAQEMQNADELVSLVGGYSTMEKGDPKKMKTFREKIEQIVTAFKTGQEGAGKVIDNWERQAENPIGNGGLLESPESKKTDSCTVCKKIGTPQELKKDAYHGKTVKRN